MKNLTRIGYIMYLLLFLGGGIIALAGGVDLFLPLWIYPLTLLWLYMLSSRAAADGSLSRSQYIDSLNADAGPYEFFGFKRFLRFLWPGALLLMLYYIFYR